jgi:phage terminase Nu1 subunit (DNA packaging protein)
MPHTDAYGGPESGSPDPDRLLTRKEAAALLGYSVRTIRRWDTEGILTPLRGTPNARPRYRRADLLAAVSANPAGDSAA